MIKLEDLKTNEKVTWCPGCGNYGIWLALKRALTELDFLEQEDVVVVYGIGCSGHMCNYLKLYGFEGLHGRPIPVAEGVKMANKRLRVIVVAGDGDTYGEGFNHFVSACRANQDITLIVHNNRVYGLTTGQATPTSITGFKSKSTPQGIFEKQLNPLATAVVNGATFVARGFAADVNHLKELFKAAILHRGFSYVDVLQQCVSFNHVNTVEWYKERIYKLEEADHNFKDPLRALIKALEDETSNFQRIPIGLFFKGARKTYQDFLEEVSEEPLVDHNISSISVASLLEGFR